MTYAIYPISAFSDNYIWLVHHQGQTLVIDPGQAEPVIDTLSAQQWSLDAILLTHHHADHIGGVQALKQKYQATLYGAKKDMHRLPPLDHALMEGDKVSFAGTQVHVIETPGHTLGHICFYAPAWAALFSGDTLFSLGCGRLFEGTAEDMYQSLQKLKALPDETELFCGHEYTLSNARFALSVERDNSFLQKRIIEAEQERAQNTPTLPVKMGEEKKTNPFLKAHNAQTLGLLRTRKDNFS